MDQRAETLEQIRDERDHLRDVLANLTGAAELPLPGLTASHSRIVRALEAAQGRVLTKDALLDALYWDRGYDEPDSKIVDMFVCLIRRRRPDLGARIETVWGVGYRMRPEGEAKP